MSYQLGHVLDHFKTEAMCNKAVHKPPYNLKPIPDDCFKNLMKQEIETWDGITCYRLCMMFFVPNFKDTRDVYQGGVHRPIQHRIYSRSL